MIRVISSSLFCLVALAVLGHGFELVEYSPEAMLIRAGSEVELFCSSNEPYTFCTWKFGDNSCNHAADTLNEMSSNNCKISEKITWNADGTRCGITITDLSIEDKGTYSCSLVHLGLDGESETESASAQMTVDVAIQTQVAFTNEFAASSPINVVAGDPAIVGCQATGGNPVPVIRVALGTEPDLIHEENDVNLVESSLGTEQSENEDGTFKLVKYFKFTPLNEDCEKFVKCEAVQYNPEGELLFDSGPTVISRQIKVNFGPQPLQEPLEDLVFYPGQFFMDIVVAFKSNPVPTNNQAIWNINPGTYENTDSIVIQAGGIPSLKYEAFPLNTTGHMVVSTLRIFNLSSVDADHIYTLDVTNGIGSNKYVVKLVSEATEDDIFLSQNSRPDYNPSDEDENIKTAGLGSGTIAGICIVVILIICIVVFVVCIKRKEMFCFAKKKTDIEKNPEAEPMNQSKDEKEKEPADKNP